MDWIAQVNFTVALLYVASWIGFRVDRVVCALLCLCVGLQFGLSACMHECIRRSVRVSDHPIPANVPAAASNTFHHARFLLAELWSESNKVLVVMKIIMVASWTESFRNSPNKVVGSQPRNRV